MMQAYSAAVRAHGRAGTRSKSSIRKNSKTKRARRSASGKRHLSRSRSSALRRTSPYHAFTGAGFISGVDEGADQQAFLRQQHQVDGLRPHDGLFPLSGQPSLSPYCHGPRCVCPGPPMENHTARGLPRDEHSTTECRDRRGARKHVLISDWEPSSGRHGLAGAVQFYAGSSQQSLSVGNYQLSEERRQNQQARNNGCQACLAETGESGPRPAYGVTGPHVARRPSVGASSLSTGEGKHDHVAESQPYYDSENLDIDFR